MVAFVLLKVRCKMFFRISGASFLANIAIAATSAFSQSELFRAKDVKSNNWTTL